MIIAETRNYKPVPNRIGPYVFDFYPKPIINRQKIVFPDGLTSGEPVQPLTMADLHQKHTFLCVDRRFLPAKITEWFSTVGMEEDLKDFCSSVVFTPKIKARDEGVIGDSFNLLGLPEETYRHLTSDGFINHPFRTPFIPLMRPKSFYEPLNSFEPIYMFWELLLHIGAFKFSDYHKQKYSPATFLFCGYHYRCRIFDALPESIKETQPMQGFVMNELAETFYWKCLSDEERGGVDQLWSKPQDA